MDKGEATGEIEDKETQNLIRISVKFSGRSIPINLSVDSTIKDLKSLLQPLTNVLPRGQKLISRGELLANEMTLRSSKITNGSKIMLMASQGLHQVDGPIKREVLALSRRMAESNRRNNEKKVVPVQKTQLKRWKPTGVLALSESDLKRNKDFTKFYVATGEVAYAPSQGFTRLVSTQRSRVGHNENFNVDIEGDAYGGGISGEDIGDNYDLVMEDDCGEGSGSCVREVFFGPSNKQSKRPSTEMPCNEKKKKKVITWEHISNQIDSALNPMSNNSATTRTFQESFVPTSTACIKLLSELPNVLTNKPFWISACIIFISKDARELFGAQPDIESRLSVIKSLVDMKNSKTPPS